MAKGDPGFLRQKMINRGLGIAPPEVEIDDPDCEQHRSTDPSFAIQTRMRMRQAMIERLVDDD